MAVHSSDVAADDHHTQSNYKQLQTKHADYGTPLSSGSSKQAVQVTSHEHCADLCVDMGGKRLHGYCALTLKCLEKGTDTVALDTRGLKIHSVELLDHGSSPVSQIPWEQQDEHPVLGQALISQLPGSCDLGDVVSIGVSFETDASSTAVQFLEPQQTAGKRHPFLFTQCQAIHARALVPCQVGLVVLSTSTPLRFQHLAVQPHRSPAGHSQHQDDLHGNRRRPRAPQSSHERRD